MCFLPIYSGHQVRWTYQPESHTGGRSHRISHPPSFCGACLNFSREKNSAIPFPRRPCEAKSCVLTISPFYTCWAFFFFFFSEEKFQSPGFELTSRRVRRMRGYQLSYRGDRYYSLFINTAVQRKAFSRSTEFASQYKIVGDNRGTMGISLVTQDAAHKGFCWTFPLYRPSRSLEQFRTQGFLRV